MTEEKARKFEEILANDEANTRLEAAGNIESMIAIMSEYGLDLSKEDIEGLMKTGDSDELDEESLEDVAGGAWSWKNTWNKIKKEVRDCINGFVDGFNSRGW